MVGGGGQTNSEEVNGVEERCRPPDIEQDMKEMERRKRVDMIMNSQMFREELERIIESQMNEGSLPANLAALHQVTELLLPGGRTPTAHCVIPINDLRGVDGLRYPAAERALRCKLASLYRLVDLYGWSQNIYNHITLRVNQEQEHFLLNPFGLQYHEVTASSLIKVDMAGNVIDSGSTGFTFNRAGFVLHSAIHGARPDIKCVIHVHLPACVAVSAARCGLLPLCQEAAIVGDVSYHDYNGLVIDLQEKEEIARDLGPVNKVMFLRNHGLVACGATAEEALFLLTNVVAACETQVQAVPIGLENLHLMSEEARQKVREVLSGPQIQVQGRPDQDSPAARKFPKVWDLEFEAQMRMLDNAGYRTGYIYRQPVYGRTGDSRTREIELPPASVSAAANFEEDKWLSPLRKLLEGRRGADKVRWVTSPNSYQRVEVLETGTPDPKKITRWVQDGTASSPVRLPASETPPPADPNEFKRKQKQLKENRLNAKVTAGPQSALLDGSVSWDQVRQVQDGEGETVVVGAASKGIIQRDFQHHAAVYRSAYARNPFDSISDQDLEEYHRAIERRQKGLEDEIPDHIKPLLQEPVAMPDEEETSENQQDDSIQNSPPAIPNGVGVDEEDTVAINGTETDESPLSPDSSKEGSPIKEITDESAKKKNKKKGLRTPSFLKKKKHRKGAEA